jgi:hypothetical protein
MAQFVVSYRDQHGMIRSCHVAEAKNAEDAIDKGREQLLAAFRVLEPAFYTKALNLTMLNWEQGEITSEGWIRDKSAEQKPK